MRFLPSILVLALAAPLAASAQDAAPLSGFDAHGFKLAPFDGDLRDPLTLDRPGRFKGGEWWLGGLGEYANAPLVRYEPIEGGDYERQQILDHVVALNLSAGVAVWKHIRLDLSAPVYFHYTDQTRNYPGVAMGDLRVGTMIALVRPNVQDEGVGFGLKGHVDVPTGEPDRFLGNRSVAGGGGLALSVAKSFFTFTADAGVQFNPAIDLDNLAGTDRITGGLGLGFKVSQLTALNVEGRVEAPWTASERVLSELPVEATLALRHRQPNGGHFLVGAAAGATQGAGAARFRAFIGGGFGKITDPVPPVVDTDGDGFFDDVDACIEIPETVNGYEDADGCPDALANLTVDVTHEGKHHEGAELVILPTEATADSRITGPGTERWTDLPPGGEWAFEATSGACLAGSGKTVLVEGENTVDVHLEPNRTAMLTVEVVTTSGEAVPGATASWRSDEAGCVPSASLDLGDGGTGTEPLGAGDHVLYVDAPGHAIHREPVHVMHDEERTVRVVLEETKVEVQADRIFILEKVHFETASAVIMDKSFALLDEVANTILAFELKQLEVQGHTDSRGSDSYNQDLSQRRADSVRAYLMDAGVSADALLAVGYGEAEPVASNGTSAGRYENRRVVFKILDDQ